MGGTFLSEVWSWGPRHRLIAWPVNTSFLFSGSPPSPCVFFGKTREGKTVKTGDGRGGRWPREAWKYLNPLFFQRCSVLISSQGVETLIRGAAGRGRPTCRLIDRGCGTSKQKRRSWHPGSTPDSGLSHRCVCKYSVTEELSKSLAIS